MRRAFILLLSAAIMLTTVSSAVATELGEFDQDEIDTNWERDRQTPTDGYSSVSAFGRDNVLRIGIDSSQTQPGLTERTEGLKTIEPMNFGTEVHIDLYLDPDWEDKAVRAGFWVVGDNGLGERDQLYGIIEFVNNEPCPSVDCSNQSNITDHEGWRTWDDTNGWINRDAEFEYGQWYTLSIELDPVNELYHFYIDRQEVGTGLGGQNFISVAIVNSYNYGEDDFPTLSSESYEAHWHAEEQLVRETDYTLCVNYWSGQVRGSFGGDCGPGETEMTTPSAQPLAFCINYYTGRVGIAGSQPCGPATWTHVVPDDGDLVTCLNLYTRMLRAVYSTTQCQPYEVPNVIEVG
jgi:hypothetical protein